MVLVGARHCEYFRMHRVPRLGGTDTPRFSDNCRAHARPDQLPPVARVAGAVLAPEMSTATRSSRDGAYTPELSAA